MRKAILLHNPFSGPLRSRRTADIEQVLDVLRSGGVDAFDAPTRAAGSAAQQVKEAIADGCDTVFACGGDGTVHDVLQGLVGTQAALGVIPLGHGECFSPRSQSAAELCGISARGPDR